MEIVGVVFVVGLIGFALWRQVNDNLTPGPTDRDHSMRPADGDCEELDGVAEFMDRDSVDPVVRHQAMEAIVHRSEELGCE